MVAPSRRAEWSRFYRADSALGLYNGSFQILGGSTDSDDLMLSSATFSTAVSPGTAKSAPPRNWFDRRVRFVPSRALKSQSVTSELDKDFHSTRLPKDIGLLIEKAQVIVQVKRLRGIIDAYPRVSANARSVAYRLVSR